MKTLGKKKKILFKSMTVFSIWEFEYIPKQNYSEYLNIYSTMKSESLVGCHCCNVCVL